MRIKSLEITNFFSFGNKERIEFENESPVLVRGEVLDADVSSNGAGKTSLFEAFYWCLTGKTMRGVKANEVIRFGESKCEVKAIFIFRECEYEVNRLYSSAKKRLSFNKKEKNGEITENKSHDSKQGTQELFYQLGVEASYLAMACFCGRNFDCFSKLKPSEKAELINYVVDGDMWRDALDNAKEEIKQSKKELEDLEYKKENDLDILESKGVYKNEMENAIEEEKEKQQRQVREKGREIEHYEDRIKEQEKELKSLSSIDDLISKEKKYKEMSEGLLEQSKEKEKELEDKQENNLLTDVHKLKSDKLDLETKKELLNEKIKRIKSDEVKEIKNLESKINEGKNRLDTGVCEACGQLLPSDYDKDDELVKIRGYEKEIDEIKQNNKIKLAKTEQELKGLEDKTDEYYKEIESLEKQIEKENEGLKELKEEVREIKEDMQLLQKKIFKVQDEREKAKDKEYELKEFITKQESQIERVKSEIEVIKNSTLIADLVGKLSEVEKGIKELEEVIKENNKEIQVVNKELEIASYWSKGFKDIWFSQFEKATQVLEELITYYCKMEGFDFDKIILENWREGSTGKALPEISLMIIRGDEKINLSSLSEGETQRVDLACFFALSKLIEERLGFDMNCFIMDEPLAGLDSDGKQRIFDVLVELAKEKQIFIIDHEASFKELFENQILIQKEKGISKIAI